MPYTVSSLKCLDMTWVMYQKSARSIQPPQLWFCRHSCNVRDLKVLWERGWCWVVWHCRRKVVMICVHGLALPWRLWEQGAVIAKVALKISEPYCILYHTGPYCIVTGFVHMPWRVEHSVEARIFDVSRFHCWILISSWWGCELLNMFRKILKDHDLFEGRSAVFRCSILALEG